MSKQVTAVAERLQVAGFRRTGPRRAVLEVLADARRHLKPEEILERARKRHPAIGRATVYRTLDLLTQLGIIRPLYIGGDGPKYISAEGGHHHFVCTGCGDVIEFDDCVACEVSGRISRRLGLKVNSHLLEFYGICRTCTRREK